MERPTRVALALGSGGARGYAHIGVIEVLDERGFEIATIAGSSMGALVGGLRAADKLGGYTEWARSLTHLDLIRLLDPSLSAPGAIRAGKVFARVRELLGGALIEDLGVPFTAVTTDLLAGKEVWFQRGPVATAIRASIAIPTIITPVMLNGRLLADGGLMNPVPVSPTVSVRSDATIAVSVSGDGGAVHDGSPAGETAEERPVEEWMSRFRRGAARLLDREMVRSVVSRFGNADHVGDDEPTPADEVLDALPPGLSKLDVMSQSLDAMQSVLTRYRLAGYPPDVLVAVPRDACRSLDFHRAAELIEIGRTLTEEALDRAGLAATRTTSPSDEAFAPRSAPEV
jgi:NTE family protein